MKAIVLSGPCEAEELTVREIPMPEVKSGWVLIKVKAFGINHSEVLLRQFEVSQPYIKKPIVPGIECVGIVEDPSDTCFVKGEKVMALMGGMGRSFDGSYAEFALVPASHVFAVDSSLDWNELAAIPETFYTAYGSLEISLQLRSDDLLLIRGGTSTVGLAAIQLAKAIGAKVVATTRREDKRKILMDVGSDDVILEGDDFVKRFLGVYPQGATKVLELIGASTLHQSLRLTSLHGIVCQTGLLGGVYGLKQFDPIKDIPSGVYLTGFYSNTPTQDQIDRMMTLISSHHIHPIVADQYDFDHVSDAHLQAEARGQIGKLVVTL